MTEHRDGLGNGNFAQDLIIDKFDKLEKAIEKLADAMNAHQLHSQDEVHDMKEELVDRINDLQKAVTRLETESKMRSASWGALTGLLTSLGVGLLLWVVRSNGG